MAATPPKNPAPTDSMMDGALGRIRSVTFQPTKALELANTKTPSVRERPESAFAPTVRRSPTSSSTPATDIPIELPIPKPSRAGMIEGPSEDEVRHSTAIHEAAITANHPEDVAIIAVLPFSAAYKTRVIWAIRPKPNRPGARYVIAGARPAGSPASRKSNNA